MGDVTRCPKCCSVVRSEAAHCPMCGADIPPQRQFGLLGVSGPQPCGAPVPPPPAPPKQRSGARVPAVFAIGCLALAVVLAAWTLNLAGKIIRRPETIVNKIVDKGARDTAERFFKRLDAGDIEAAWGMGDSAMHSGTTLREFRQYAFALQARFGPRVRPVIKSVKIDKKSLNGKSSTIYTLVFETEFRKGTARETLVIAKRDRAYAVHAYNGPALGMARRTPQKPGGRDTTPSLPKHAAPMDAESAKTLAARFLDAMNTGTAAAWDMTGGSLRGVMDRSDFNKLVKDIKAAHGKRLEHSAVGFNSTSVFANGQARATITVTFSSRFEKGGALEEVTLEQTADGPAVAFYSIASEAVDMPDIRPPDPFENAEPAPEPGMEQPQIEPDRGLEI